MKELQQRVIVFIGCLFFVSIGVQAQYWFGPKIGGNLSDFIYQDSEYVSDSFDIDQSSNFEIGGIFIYQATDMFSVQGELFYERLTRTLENKPTLNQNVFSEMNYNFISVPMLFRVSFGNEPVHVFLDGGIKLKFWLGGNGTIESGDGEFGDGEDIVEKIVFRQSKSETLKGTYAVSDANIMQFGLSVGGGMYLDLRTNGRLLLDLKYTFGHSNMGFNGNQDFDNDITGYTEKFTFRANTLSLSLAYLFQYDVKLHSKGMSTSEKSNKAHSKKKK